MRCKLAGCNRVAIGKVQLCRAHGGGARSKQESIPSEGVRLPMSSNFGATHGSMHGTFCVPIIEPAMDGYIGQQEGEGEHAVGTDLANI